MTIIGTASCQPYYCDVRSCEKKERCKYSIYPITPNKSLEIYYIHHIVNQIVQFDLMTFHIFSKLLASQQVGTTSINE